jgi:hypothetical protein
LPQILASPLRLAPSGPASLCSAVRNRSRRFRQDRRLKPLVNLSLYCEQKNTVLSGNRLPNTAVYPLINWYLAGFFRSRAARAGRNADIYAG